jgi:hypothetical protein
MNGTVALEERLSAAFNPEAPASLKKKILFCLAHQATNC